MTSRVVAIAALLVVPDAAAVFLLMWVVRVAAITIAACVFLIEVLGP